MNEYDISRAFKRIENDLMDSMMHNMKKHQVEETELGIEWEQWQALQLKELERYRKENADRFTKDFAQINRKVEAMFKATCNNAQSKQESYILEQIKKGDFTPTQVKDTQFFNLNDKKLDILIERTKADFTRAEYAMLRKADDVYRQTIFDAQVYASVTNDYAKAVDMATHDFLKKGIQCVTYSNGAKHTISDYAEMCVRTGNKRAYLMGEGNAHDKYGIHTVRVNKRTQACPKCVKFLGRVLIDDVYNSGTAKEAFEMGVPTLSSAIQEGFLHPNCKDIYSLYIPDVSKPPTPWTQQEINEIVGDYNKEQAIQHANDMLESYARLAKYALDPENQKRYQARAQMWDKRAIEIERGETPKPVIPQIQQVLTEEVTPTLPDVLTEAETQETEIRTKLAEIKDRRKVVQNQIDDSTKELNIIKGAGAYYNDKLAWRPDIKEGIQRLREQHEKFSYLYQAETEWLDYIEAHLDDIQNNRLDELKAPIEAEIKEAKKRLKPIDKELDAQYNELEAIVGKPNTVNLAVYGNKNTKAIEHFLDDAPQEYRDAWNKCADNFNPLGSKDRFGKRRKGAYYSASEDGVYLSIKSASEGNGYETPYQVVFHEYGHNIDYVLNRIYGDGDKRKAFTTTYKDGIFGKTLAEEANEAIEAFGRENGFVGKPNKGTVVANAESMVQRGLLKREEKAEWIKLRLESETVDRFGAEKAFCKYIKENYATTARSDISDMFEPVMENKDNAYPFGFGHGRGYWTRYNQRRYETHGKEAFAEMYSAMIANGDSWESINKFFPRSVQIFREILEVTKL